MKLLKSAYQLASERVIESKYAKQLIAEKIKQKNIEKEHLDSLPDFVAAWELKQKDDENELSFKNRGIEEVDILNSPTKLYSQSEIEKIRQQKFKKEVDLIDSENVKVVEPETFNVDDIPELHWYGHFTSYGGFSRMNRAFAFGLSNRGVKVRIDMQNCNMDVNEATKRELDILSSVEIDPSAPKVFGATLPLTMLHSGKKILYTMMETSETLHKDYVERLNLFDEIWVPTNHGATMFRNNGVTRHIQVMPLGVDIERYNQTISPYSFEESLNKFVFISVFKWGYRKGYDILLKAYMDEFSSDEDVSLLILTRSEIDPNPNRIQEDFGAIRGGIDKQDSELPHIALYTKLFSEKDMPKLYRSADAFVLISRGEGFGLPYYEAASCGLPVIGSDCSGQSDILNDDNSFLVKPDIYSRAKVNGNMSKLAKHCRFYEDQVFPDFGQEAILKTRKHMRYVYENYDKACKKAKILTKEIRQNYSWDKAVDRVLNRIRELR